MNATIQKILVDALDLAEASAKRGKNSKNAQFAPIYDKILADIMEARTFLAKQKIVS